MVTIKENKLSDVQGNAWQQHEEQDSACSNLNIDELQSSINQKNKKQNKNQKIKKQNKNLFYDLPDELQREIFKRSLDISDIYNPFQIKAHSSFTFEPKRLHMYDIKHHIANLYPHLTTHTSLDLHMSHLINTMDMDYVYWTELQLTQKVMEMSDFLYPRHLLLHDIMYGDNSLRSISAPSEWVNLTPQSGVAEFDTTSEHIYGNFDNNSEELYGHFIYDDDLANTMRISADHNDRINLANERNICECGSDICSIHPSNRGSGLYDPEDYIDGSYSPQFSDSDESFDISGMTFDDDFDFLEKQIFNKLYTFKYDKARSLESLIPEHERRNIYVTLSNNYTNIFGDIVKIDKSYLRPQSGSLWYRLNKMQENAKIAESKFNEKYIVKLVDDVIHFIKYATEDVVGMTRIQIILRACTNFLKLRLNESTYHTLKDKAIPFLLNILDKMSIQNFEECIEKARTSLGGMKNIFSSPIMSKLHQCCLYMMSLSIFDNLGIDLDMFNYTALEKASLKKKYSNTTDFFYVLCETVLFIAERGYQVYITGDFSTMFHSGGQYKKLYDMCREIIRKQPLLNNPETHGFTESSYRADLDNVIEKLNSVNKFSYCLNSQEKNTIKETLFKMSLIRDELNTRSAARRNRKAPFGLLIYGDSGVGKTTVTAMMATYFAKHEDLSTKSEFRYTVNPAAKYWDGFVSSCHTVILDDVANEHPDLKDSKSLDNVIQIMNNQAFCPDQASLESKGTTPFRGKLVIATTNVKNLNACAYFSCPSAAQRRFPFVITPKPKREFKDERGMLCTKNVPEDATYPDLWDFDVDMVVPLSATQGRHYAKFEQLYKDLNTQQLLVWFDKAINDFNRDQEKVSKCIERMEKEELCECCVLPESLCTLKPQGLVTNLLTVSVAGLVMYHSNFMFMKSAYETYIGAMKCKQTFLEFKNKSIENVCKLKTKEFWITMGEKVQESLGHKGILISLAAGTILIMGMYSVTKQTLIPQGDVSASIGTTPEPEENGRENVWYNNTMELSSAHFSRESASSKSTSFEDFCSKISNNVVSISTALKGTTNARVGKLLGLGGHIYITNNHNIPDCAGGVSCKLYETAKLGINSNMQIILTESDIHRVPDKDIAFVIIREMPPKKKITQYFLKETEKGVFNGAYVSRTSQGERINYNLKNIQLMNEKVFKFENPYINAKISCWKGISSSETQYGDCGAPMIVESDFGYSILGIHFLIDTREKSEIYANSIDGKFIEQVYEKLTPFNTQSGCFDLISSESVNRPVLDLHKKSVFRYINDGSADIFGSFADFRGKSKSRVVDTPMSKKLPAEYKKKYTTPEMTSYEPWRIAALDILQPVQMNTEIINECVNSYIQNVIKRVNPENIKGMLMVLDDFTALNGARVAYIDKINRSTSAGNPWKKSKKYFLKSIPPAHGMQDPVEISDKEMNSRIDLIIETYLSGARCNPNFCAHLKDEPVTFSKAKAKKTRVFTGAPFDWCVVVRKYLLSFCRLLQNERFAFEAAPGTVAQSLEWQEIYDYIIQHGVDRIVAGDYKAYDKKMSPKEILAAFDIIIHFCKLSGNYTEKDIKVIQGIAEDTAFAIVDFNGDLVQLFGSNPSGNPLTVILNSIVNSLRMRYNYYLQNPEGEVLSFGDKVALMTYGDDNIMSVHKECNWFNHTSIAKTFAEIGIVYTMADKEAKSVPFIHIDDASFLKRTWRYDEDMKCKLGPLDHDSIEKMLMVWVKSKSVTEEYQGVSVICTALQEYFFYGKQVFDEKRPILLGLIEKLGWEDYVNKDTFPTYEDLVMRYMKSSSKCFSYEECFAPQSGLCLFSEVPEYENIMTVAKKHNNGTPPGDPFLNIRIIWIMLCWFVFFLRMMYLVLSRGIVLTIGLMRSRYIGNRLLEATKEVILLVMLVLCFNFIEKWIHLIVLMYTVLQTKRNFYLFLNSINNMSISSLLI